MSLSALYAQLHAAQREKAENDRKIARLKPAKKSMQQIKNRLEDRSRRQKSTARKDETYCGWVGKTQQKAEDNFGSSIPSEYSRYIRSVDSVLDAICDEITRLENENARLLGLIGYLIATINSILNAMEKATN